MSSAGANVIPLRPREVNLTEELRVLREKIDQLTAHPSIAHQDNFYYLQSIGKTASTPVPDEASVAPARTDRAARYRVILVLTWLLAVGLPFAEAQLSMTAQMVITNEFATVALALAVTWREVDRRKK